MGLVTDESTWNNDGMILTGEKLRYSDKNLSCAKLSTTNATDWPGTNQDSTVGD